MSSGESSFPSDITLSTVGQRKNRRAASSTHGCDSVRHSHIHESLRVLSPEEVVLLETTQSVLADLRDDSRLCQNPIVAISALSPQDVTTGDELGRGEYGIVFAVTALRCSKKPSNQPMCMSTDFNMKGAVAVEIAPSKAISSEKKNIAIGIESSKHQIDMLPPPPQQQPTHTSAIQSTITSICATTSPLIPPKSIVIHPHKQVEHQPDQPTLLNKHCRKDSRSTLAPVTENVNIANNVSTFYPPRKTSDLTDFDELTDFDDDDDDDDDDDALNNKLDDIDLTRRLSIRVYRNGTPRYALKRLHDENTKGVDAVVDLACEAEFLKHLWHPNIIRLRAVVGQPGTIDYALILDRLTRTLTDQIQIWRDQVKQNNRQLLYWMGGHRYKAQKQLKALVTDRILVCFDIVRAMQHLHQLRIIYRDLKPDNCGFSMRGDLKLFDFGLAKELKDRDLKVFPEGYDCTGLTGSRRYMSPEVVQCRYYGYSADIYSFALLMWEVMALRTPFPKLNARQHLEQVVLRGKRPGRLSDAVPLQVRILMQEAWSHEPVQRPTFRQIYQVMLAVLSERMGVSADVVSDRSATLLDRSLRSMYGEEQILTAPRKNL